MKPTLEEVQEYFKDAEIVESVYKSEFTGLNTIHEFSGDWFCKDNSSRNRCIWRLGIYAKIIKTKTMKIEVTEEKIKGYYNDACQSFKTRIEKDFPSLFKVTLQVGKWYKTKEYENFLIFLKKDADFSNYGFNTIGEWSNELGMASRDSLTPATDEEVSTALIAEAKRRGYKKGNHKCLSFCATCNPVKSKYFFQLGDIWIGETDKCNLIFERGVWAEIIKEEPVYEWQYVYYDSEDETHGLTVGFYKSKKDFSRRLYDLTPIHKLKESKRIRE